MSFVLGHAIKIFLFAIVAYAILTIMLQVHHVLMLRRIHAIIKRNEMSELQREDI